MGEPVIGTEIAEEGVSIVALHEHDLGLGIQLRVGLGGRIVRDTRLQGHLGTQVPVSYTHLTLPTICSV